VEALEQDTHFLCECCKPNATPSAPVCELATPETFAGVSAVQEKRIANTVEALEQDTGFRLRVLAQNYPETPGAQDRLASDPDATCPQHTMCIMMMLQLLL
jgi:hypothetical protein